MSRPRQDEPVLAIRGLEKSFYGVHVLREVDLDVHRGELVSLIGPNGSGKTTLFNCVTGYIEPERGSVRFLGKSITRLRPDAIALNGLVRTFQNVKVFPSLTVLDNMLVAIQQHQERGLLQRVFPSRRVRTFEREAVTRADELLEMFMLLPKRSFLAGSLSYGQRKLLAFASALMPDPELLLLDEPAAAVNPTVINTMKEAIVDLNRRGKTFLLVEHNMEVVMDISHRVIVLDHGEKIAEGTPDEVKANEQVMEAYFGY